VDVTNALNEEAGLAVGFTTSGGEELQKKLPRAHEVKALNTVFAGLMETGQVEGQPLSAFVAGDDDVARSTVMELARDIGFDAVNSGSLKNARLLEPLGVLNIQLGYFLGYGAQGGFRHLHAAAEVASGTHNEYRHGLPSMNPMHRGILAQRNASRLTASNAMPPDSACRQWELRNGLAPLPPLKPN
jgi:hypothetical protein